MGRLATVSFNFSDCRPSIIISVPANTPEIIAKCGNAIAKGTTYYFIQEQFNGYIVLKQEPDSNFPCYVSLYRNGEYSWVDDFLFAKTYSKKKAVEHVLNLYFLKGE